MRIRAIFVAMALLAIASWAEGAPNAGVDAANRTKAALEASVPRGWQVSVKGAVVTVTSPHEMKLDPSPATGLPNRSVVQRFKIYIRVGERISIKEQERRSKAEADSVDRLGKTSDYREWLPNFFDDDLAYDLDFPSYCPADDADLKAVNECYLSIRRHWAAYPTSENIDSAYLSALSFYKSHGG